MLLPEGRQLSLCVHCDARPPQVLLEVIRDVEFDGPVAADVDEEPLTAVPKEMPDEFPGVESDLMRAGPLHI